MKKLFTLFILPVLTVVLAYFIINSITKPVKFNKEVEARKVVAIERLKDIRTLQATYKSAYNHYAPCMDSLIDFYNNGKINIILQIGSPDDSLAFSHTQQLRSKLGKKASDKFIYDNYYLQGDHNLVLNIPMPIAVKDTLFNSKPNFNVNDLRYIPFSDQDTIIMSTIIKVVSGVDVPLFEAKIPYGVRPAPGQPFRGLLMGLDEQLIINLNAEMEDTNRYPGLMVGSIENANNNAGNWE